MLQTKEKKVTSLFFSNEGVTMQNRIYRMQQQNNEQNNTGKTSRSQQQQGHTKAKQHQNHRL